MTTLLHAVDRPNGLSGAELAGTRPMTGRAEHPKPVAGARSAPPSPHGEADIPDGEAPDPDDRQLSVTEIQQALRELRARRAGTRVGETSAQPEVRSEKNRERWPRRADSQRHHGDDGASVPHTDRGGGSDFASDWVTVLAAHAGAGASTVALAISDAAAVADRRVHLVEGARPSRSGLVAATSAELGRDATGTWRRGARSGITIDRRAGDTEPHGWPIPSVGEVPAFTVVDLGPLASTHLASPAAFGARTVLVCRATLPGVRRTEHMLRRLSEAPVVVAAVGPRRWPRQLTATIGPRLLALRDAGRVVPVPIDARLEITGLTSAPLPRRVLAAGNALVALLDAADPEATVEQPATASRTGRVYR